MSVFIYDTCMLSRMEMLCSWGLCGIRRGEDKGHIVREKWRASPRQRDYVHACG